MALKDIVSNIVAPARKAKEDADREAQRKAEALEKARIKAHDESCAHRKRIGCAHRAALRQAVVELRNVVAAEGAEPAQPELPDDPTDVGLIVRFTPAKKGEAPTFAEQLAAHDAAVTARHECFEAAGKTFAYRARALYRADQAVTKAFREQSAPMGDDSCMLTRAQQRPESGMPGRALDNGQGPLDAIVGRALGVNLSVADLDQFLALLDFEQPAQTCERAPAKHDLERKQREVRDFEGAS